MDYTGNCNFADTYSRVQNPQPFKDIAKCLCEEFNRDDNKIETATQYLKEMSLFIREAGISGSKLQKYISKWRLTIFRENQTLNKIARN